MGLATSIKIGSNSAEVGQVLAKYLSVAEKVDHHASWEVPFGDFGELKDVQQLPHICSGSHNFAQARRVLAGLGHFSRLARFGQKMTKFGQNSPMLARYLPNWSQL